MKTKALIALPLLLGLGLNPPAVRATGLATCDSGPEETWQKQEVLQERLEQEGWTVRRIKVDGGCYEVYALDAEGERVEAYFDPVTLKPVAIEED